MYSFLYFLYRSCNRIYIKKGKSIWVRILGKIYSDLLSLFFSAYIPYTASIGKNVIFIHKFHGIFISKDSKIGEDCIIHHHVTIGSSKDPGYNFGTGERQSPEIGKNVFIGANSNIIGRCVIGDNCVIGAGTSIANTTIPPNKLIVPQKWRIIDR